MKHEVHLTKSCNREVADRLDQVFFITSWLVLLGSDGPPWMLLDWFESIREIFFILHFLHCLYFVIVGQRSKFDRSCFFLQGNIVSCAILGSYAAIIPIDHYIGSSLKYIVLNVVRRATISNFGKAVLDPPYQDNGRLELRNAPFGIRTIF